MRRLRAAFLAYLMLASSSSRADLIRPITAQACLSGDAIPPADGAALALTPGDQQIGLAWNPATDNVGVDHYVIRVAPGTTTPPANCSAGSPVTGCGNTAATSCTGTGLSNLTDYAFIVCAYDAASNFSTGLTATTQPFIDSRMMVYDGCDTAGGCGTEEFTTTPDNAAFECGAHLTFMIVLMVTTCTNGTTCDDIGGMKGSTTNDSYSHLVEFQATGWSDRFAITGLANFYQFGPVGAVSRGVTLVGTYDGTQVDGGDAGSDANDERSNLYTLECGSGSNPTCPTLTARTSGAFNGTIGTTISDQPTTFLTGGQTATRFNLAGNIDMLAIWCDGIISITDAQNCLLNSSNKPANLTAMSSACNTAFSHRAVWYSFGDQATTSNGGNDVITAIVNRFATTAGNAAHTNMEVGDIQLNNL